MVLESRMSSAKLSGPSGSFASMHMRWCNSRALWGDFPSDERPALCSDLADMDEAILNLVKAATWLAISRRFRVDEVHMIEAVAKVCVAVDAVLDRADELDHDRSLEPSVN
jgi:hypothetical protein